MLETMTWCALRARAGPDQLVAGGEERHAGFPGDADLRDIGGGDQSEVAGAQAVAGLQQRLAAGEVAAGAADVAADRRRLGHGDGIALAARILLDDDGVGPVAAPPRR